MVKRILKRASEAEEKRADDNEATIKNRIETFVKNTDEILSQYPNQTKRVMFSCFVFAFKLSKISHFHFYTQVDGERNVDDIFQDVSLAIDDILDLKNAIVAN